MASRIHMQFERERCRCGHTPADPSLGPRPFRLPGDPERFGRSRPFDLEHLRVELRLLLVHKRLVARAVLRIRRRDSQAKTCVFDAVGFEQVAVSSPGAKNLSWRYDGDQLHVSIDDSLLDANGRMELSVSYEVEPRRGLYFFAPVAHDRSRPVQVWTQCQDEDARYWVPCLDFPGARMSSELVVTAPEGWTVLSNGRLVSRSKVDGGAHGADTKAIGASGPGEERWHWHQEQPHAAYLLTLVAGRFAELVADRASLPMRYYVDPGREEDGWRTFRRTPEMVAHFEKQTGVEFPWAKYHQVAVHEFTFGGMENTSATTMTDRALLTERAAIDQTMDDLVAHELAHQWFGDLVTCRDWSHAWLNEGFATFMEHVDREAHLGIDEALYGLKEHAEAYLAEDGGRYRRPVVCNTYAAPIDLFDRHLYEKGGWALHMLRAELGTELFWSCVRHYLEKHRGTAVETNDLLRAFEERSGRSLEGFFAQWLYKAGHPELECTAEHNAEKSILRVTVKQTQTVDAVTPLFQCSLLVSVVTDDGEELHSIALSESSHTVALRVKGTVRRVVFDPDYTLLCTMHVELPRDWQLDALENDPRASVRWRAAEALARRDEPTVVKALVQRVRKDSFWGVAAEAAGALGRMHSERAEDALCGLLSHEHPKVRRAVVAALGEFRSERAALALTELLERGDPSQLVEASAARAAGQTKQSLVFDHLVKALQRTSWNEQVRVGVVEGFAALRDERAISHIDPFADVGPDARLRLRRAVVLALAELGDGNKRVRERLEALLDPRDPYFTPELLRALVRLRERAAASAIRSLLERTEDGRVRRHAREALRALSEQSRGDELKKLSDALEQLRDEHRSLRDALAELKAGDSADVSKEKTKKSSGSRARKSSRKNRQSKGTRRRS